MIDPGKMSDRILLLKRDTKTVEEPYQHEIEFWREIGKAWSQYRPTGGREFREGVVAVGEERATFTCHYRDGLANVDRIVFKGKVWDIQSVNRVGWKAAIDINATSTGETYTPDKQP